MDISLCEFIDVAICLPYLFLNMFGGFNLLLMCLISKDDVERNYRDDNECNNLPTVCH